MEDKVKFCIRYLAEKGITPDRYSSLYYADTQPEFAYSIMKIDDDFFTQAAKGLWDMWPVGKKDGKYPWKESVPVLRDRLIFIWNNLKITEQYTVEDILQAGRKYIAQYEHANTKYMQLLKYFIFKQKTMGFDDKGVYKNTYESTLVKLLQEKGSEESFESINEFVL